MTEASFETLVDRAAEMCGGQNALARKLGITSGNLSDAKHGRRPLPKIKLEALAELLAMEAGDVWMSCEIANAARRNPFRDAGRAVSTAVIGALTFATLSLAPNASEASNGAGSQPIRAERLSTHYRKFRRALSLSISAILSAPFGAFFVTAIGRYRLPC